MSDPRYEEVQFGEGCLIQYQIDNFRSRGYAESVIAVIAKVNKDVYGKYDYADNHRYALKSRYYEREEYRKIKQSGCCGFFDIKIPVEYEMDGKTIPDTLMIGFNYGH